MATLNVTHDGQSQDICELDYATSDEDVRRIAVEALSLRPNIFINFVVDRFSVEQGERIYLRPKVPFGC